MSADATQGPKLEKPNGDSELAHEAAYPAPVFRVGRQTLDEYFGAKSKRKPVTRGELATVLGLYADKGVIHQAMQSLEHNLRTAFRRIIAEQVAEEVEGALAEKEKVVETPAGIILPGGTP